MRGMSLALETVIVLILALTVFTGLTYFFNIQFGKGSQDIDAVRGQTEACAAYIRQDSKCSSTGYGSVDKKTLSQISYYCSRLQGYTPTCSCTKSNPNDCSAASLNCVVKCCALYCPAGTAPQPTTRRTNEPILTPV